MSKKIYKDKGLGINIYEGSVHDKESVLKNVKDYFNEYNHSEVLYYKDELHEIGKNGYTYYCVVNKKDDSNFKIKCVYVNCGLDSDFNDNGTMHIYRAYDFEEFPKEVIKDLEKMKNRFDEITIESLETLKRNACKKNWRNKKTVCFF